MAMGRGCKAEKSGSKEDTPRQKTMGRGKGKKRDCALEVGREKKRWGRGQKGIYCCQLIDKEINNNNKKDNDDNNCSNNGNRNYNKEDCREKEREAARGADGEGRLEMDGWDEWRIAFCVFIARKSVTASIWVSVRLQPYSSCRSWIAHSSEDWMVIGNFVSNWRQSG